MGRLLRNFARRVGDGGNIDYQVAAVDVRWNSYRIAAARLPDTGYVDCRSAISAHHVRAALPVTCPSANHAGIERGSPSSVGFAYDNKAQGSIVCVHGKEVQTAVV